MRFLGCRCTRQRGSSAAGAFHPRPSSFTAIARCHLPSAVSDISGSSLLHSGYLVHNPDVPEPGSPLNAPFSPILRIQYRKCAHRVRATWKRGRKTFLQQKKSRRILRHRKHCQPDKRQLPPKRNAVEQKSASFETLLCTSRNPK